MKGVIKTKQKIAYLLLLGLRLTPPDNLISTRL